MLQLRTPILPSEFSKAELKELAQEAKQPEEDRTNRKVLLPEEDMRTLRLMQARNRSMYARQLRQVWNVLWGCGNGQAEVLTINHG